MRAGDGHDDGGRMENVVDLVIMAGNDGDQRPIGADLRKDEMYRKPMR